MAIEGDGVFSANISVFNGATDGAGYSDMSKVDTDVHFQTGCMKVVFLNKFVMNLLVSVLVYIVVTDEVHVNYILVVSMNHNKIMYLFVIRAS